MKKIIEIVAGRHIKLSNYGLFAPKIKQLWTIYDEDEVWNYCKYNPDNGMMVDRNNLESLKLFHHHGAFIEDEMHDWNVDYKNNFLNYYSRVVEQGEPIKILIDYEEMKCENCPNWQVGGFDLHFCGVTGCSKSNSGTCETSEKNVFDHGTVY